MQNNYHVVKKIVNSPAVSGWGLFPSGYCFDYQVARTFVEGGVSKFFTLKQAIRAAQDAGVPCDNAGWVTQSWVEKRYVNKNQDES